MQQKAKARAAGLAERNSNTKKRRRRGEVSIKEVIFKIPSTAPM